MILTVYRSNLPDASGCRSGRGGIQGKCGKMLNRLIAICVAFFVLAAATTSHAQDRSGAASKWVKLATRSIDLRKGRSSIRIGAARQPLKAIRFRTLRRSLRLTGITVYFKGGRRLRVNRSFLSRANRYSRTISLGRDGQHVERIVISYQRSVGRLRWLGLEIHGLWIKPTARPSVVAKKKTGPNIPGVRLPVRKALRPFSRPDRRTDPSGGSTAATRQPVFRKYRKTRKVAAVPPPSTSTRSIRDARAPAAANGDHGAPKRSSRAPAGESTSGGSSSGTGGSASTQPRSATRSLRVPPPSPGSGAPGAGPSEPPPSRPAPPPMAMDSPSEPGSQPVEEERPAAKPEIAAREAPADDKEEADSGPAAAGTKDYDVMPVYYGTDRKNEPDEKRPHYTSDRAEKLQLGRALVTIPRTHTMPNVERPWAINIPFIGRVQLQSEDPKKHFTIKELKELAEADFLRFVKQRLARSKSYRNQALVFIHGFNNTFDGALYRTAQIAFDLKFDGAPFMYSWPSAGGLTSYFYDRESATAARPHLRKFLELVTQKTGVDSVSIIAHSMGNVALLEVLRDLKNLSPGSVKINQIILAAPDVGITNFKILAQEIRGLSNGVTLYASANDRALEISRQFFGGVPRAGDVPEGGP
ncbi:MAG TPA: alpha/beta hydrolase, partial [Rhizobiales bacterium]|nr:alpha/beta hydrolase [Hyphomicrobiales bacterium]